MSPSKQHADMKALREAALEDLMDTSGADLLKEAIADGEDVDALDRDIKIGMRNAAAEALREQAAQSKQRFERKAAPKAGLLRPTIDAIKRMVDQAFQRDQSLGLAFRSGKRQSDEDWRTLYDDLIALGKIDPNADVD